MLQLRHVLLFTVLAGAWPAQAQSRSSGTYFSSAGAAYMNTLMHNNLWMTAEMSRAKATGRTQPQPQPQAQVKAPEAVPLSVSDFRPVPEERDAVLDSLVSGLAAGPARDQQRLRLDVLADAIENRPGARKNNLAEVTYLLVGLSLQIASGRPLEPARAQELTRAINAAYASDEQFAKLDDRAKSRMYYLYEATIGLTGAYHASKDPAEVAAAKALAQNTLKQLGIQP